MRLRAKQHLKRYLEMGLAVLLVLTALLVPQGWFALRDEALEGHVQGEVLSPLMVAQLDHSYEQDIYERMSACLAAINSQDVMCSSKEMDIDSESLWENIGQAQEGVFLEALRWNVVRLMEEEGWQPTIESCMQYALMRKSDGELLLVANDILLEKGDGSHVELLLDGVDGAVYYLESEGDYVGDTWYNWRDNPRVKCWEWWRILNNIYDTEEAKSANVEALPGLTNAEIAAYNTYDGLLNVDESTTEEIETLTKSHLLLWNMDDDFVKIWFDTVYGGNYDEISYTYCCLLAFGEQADSWTMELERKDQKTFYRVRMGLPWVVRAIPEMAERISLPEYRDIHQW